MLIFRNEKQRLRYLRCISSGSVILEPRNGDISGASTSDLESLEKEMERLCLQAQMTAEAKATAMACRRMLLSHSVCTYSMYYTKLVSGSSVPVSNGAIGELVSVGALFAVGDAMKRKSKDDEEIVQDTKGEALSYMGKKAMSEDEVEEEYAESTTL
ncbi:hypothetical protein V501_01608 [Pseudogymnoascus sp. VKM F-4519 (FW-2642)]|nr:hypothetical protein V501_01608 [Pseudogymnoascus sp. VKM F-4519 (FW-2642)]